MDDRSTVSTVRAAVKAMAPYVPGKPIDEVKRELGLSHVVKLASNENPLGPSPKAVKAVQAAAQSMHLYPDASGHELKTAIADRFSVSKENVLLGNGSDELIHLIGLVFLAPGDNMVVGDPTFVRYQAAAELAEIELRKVSLDSEWRHDLTAMAAACDARTKLVFVADPHNPTGTTVGKAAIEQMLEALPPTTTLVLDEAYFEYGELGDAPDGRALVLDGRRVIALRTFSKAYGLAGIRVGYGFASADIVDAIDRAREPFNVNSLAQVAAIAALDDAEHLDRSRAINAEGIRRIAAEVGKAGYSTVPSNANFVCIKLGRDAGPVFQALLRKGVIVRSGDPLGMPGYIRVSIGTEDEVSEFLEAFSTVMATVV